MQKFTTVIATFAFFFCCGSVRAAVTFDWVTVGDAGNKPDQLYATGLNPDNVQFGAVGYTYRISKHEVTNAQYVEFLNAVDPQGTNPNGVYNSNNEFGQSSGITFRSAAANGSKYATRRNMDNKPVNYVSFFDAMRFINWLENGQPLGGSGTETGVYAIGNGVTETRATGAGFFLPSEDEWYKAAYYQPATQGGDSDDYWLYATRSNSAPTKATANTVGDINNPGAHIANYDAGAGWNNTTGNVTTVGSAGPLSSSYYGTSDQDGNVWEWNEGLTSTFRSMRGTFFNDPAEFLGASVRFFIDPSQEDHSIGFRVASVPEPNCGFLFVVGTLGVALYGRREGRSEQRVSSGREYAANGRFQSIVTCTEKQVFHRQELVTVASAHDIALTTWEL